MLTEEVTYLDMKKIEELKWHEYILSELFKITSTKSSIDRNKLTGELGDYPYVTRSDTDNGMDSFIGIQPEYLKDEGNVITIGLDTQTVFYQPADFYTGQNIQVLRNEHLNKYVAMFIVPLIKKQMKKFNWGGNGATLGRLRKVTLLLPSTECNVPDYDYMERYMKQVEVRILKKYKNYLQTKKLKANGKNLKCDHWNEFQINDIGEILSGQDIYERERIDGNNPYVTSTALQNGIGYFVGNTNKTFSKGCISVNRNGSVGYAFYHPYKALFGNDTRRITPHNHNRWTNFFITRAITQQKGKYGYGLKFGTERLKKQIIVLPATEDNQPDYKFMGKYMHNVECRLLNSYINKRLKQLDEE